VITTVRREPSEGFNMFTRHRLWAVAAGGLLVIAGGSLLVKFFPPTAPVQPAPPAETGLEVTAYWEPFAESRGKFAETWDELRTLQPAHATKTYAAEDFRAFLAREQTAVGEVWELDGERLLPFLKQFHAGATLQLHHGFVAAPGAFACLRARDDRYDEVVFRLHAEFLLSDGKSFYTPAQFAGRVLFDRAAKRVSYFRCHLPPRNTNVDVNRFQPPKDGKDTGGPPMLMADIGYAPRMELVGGDEPLANGFRGKEAIEPKAAEQKLARRFYKFSEIHWLPWDEAVAESVRTGKPLHVVALFGALDDESC
jgi:hypothetical protein